MATIEASAPAGPATASIRPMELADIPAVTAIEGEAFSPGWPRTAYQRELTQNAVARYLVLTLPGQRRGGLRGALHRRREVVTGFGGLWLMGDQAHIVTIAVAPAQRGKGNGRALLLALLELGEREGMASATLEGRVSNQAARRLYRQHGFVEVGERPRYYSDNHESAVIMTTEDFDSSRAEG